MREFGFELRLCAHLECDREGIVARQLGASAGAGVGGGRRVVDVLLVEPGPTFDERAAITDETIPRAALASTAGVGEWRPVTAVFDAPPERAREHADAAVGAGFFERTRRGGRDVVRQVARYPEEWFGRLVGIENKPDLGAPGDLETQLRKDVSLGLLDAVVLATESYVTGAHRNRLPPEVGIWRVDVTRPNPIEVLREPTALPTDEPGLQLVERRPDRADVRVATAAEKARRRRQLAERAYGKGWRVPFPDCARVERERVAGTDTVPYCPWKGRVIDPGRDCGSDCGGYDPGAPPDVDRRAERDRRQAWVADPEGRTRRQAGLDRY